MAPAAARAPQPSVAVAPVAPPTEHAQATGYTDVNTDNSLNSNGSVTASSTHLLGTASAFRREVYRLGGRVYAEQIHYQDDRDDDGREASIAVYKVKLLPRMLPDLLDWLGRHSTITAQDVSSIMAMESEADASIARPDVRDRIAELDKQLDDTTLDPQIRAAMEQERDKLVGNAIADPNALADNTKRVAVLEVHLEAPHLVDPYAHGKLLGNARGSFLDLGAFGTGGSSRLGAGIGIGGQSPVAALEVIGYAAHDAGGAHPAVAGATMDEHAGVIVTFGTGGYAKALGGGRRSMFNPYVGARLGYAYFQASYLALAAELGVELVKQRGVLWTVSARPMGFLGGDAHGALEVGSSIGLAF